MKENLDFIIQMKYLSFIHVYSLNFVKKYVLKRVSLSFLFLIYIKKNYSKNKKFAQ